MFDLDRLKEHLQAKILESRVSEEAQDLSGQYFAGTIWWTVARGVGTAAAILVGLGGIVLSSGDCTQACLWFTGLGCCWTTTSSLVTFGAMACVVFGGSFFATKSARERHFQQSALCSTFVLLGVSVIGIVGEAPILFFVLAVPLLFLTLFWGYRTALRSILHQSYDKRS
jgi:hypothetical protein